ncbi:pyridine nucleotide-disulfide oxidoreductase [Veronia nyctiphanis]|uniref:Pyridine nucleotide-disulfide oxidoreductase n=1 Tax=Veronia nyctiphanis TaxID=1278244 RepID=A0A4Q0YV43_9GAMM|nr:FAD-dependent oxidoreductase [Veronia nyctiphanis]RXJ74084.1 pyridine nucleotide-disulfide oxidoreductase [Veronia nyctiphanis]
MNTKKIAIIAVIITFIAIWFGFDLDTLFTLENAKQQQAALAEFIEENWVTASIIYFSAYIAITALSLPGAAIATLLGAALFGFWWSLLLVSFASSIGATAAFLVSRFLLKDWVMSKFGNKLDSINKGIEKDGAFYLLTLRLIPVFPFFLINLLMGLTPLKASRFYLISQLGMLPGTMVYLNAGSQLAQIESLSGIISPEILISLALLGIFPLIAKFVIDNLNHRRIYSRFTKPKTFDRNIIAIGAGAGGLVTTYVGAVVKAKVTIIEKHLMGGDCLNTGCVPSKALIRSGQTLKEIQRAKEFGIHVEGEPKVDFAQVMGRIRNVIAKIEPHDSVERYTSLGAECIQGEAKILSPWEVEVNGQVLTTKNIVIATGARPLVPGIPGLADVNYLTSETVWSLETLPPKMLVMGGGPIGCELAQSFARLGSEVTLVEMADQLLIREDADVSELVYKGLIEDGVNVLLGHKATQFTNENGKQTAILEYQGSTVNIDFDAVMVALGRVANVKGFGLEELGVELTERGTVKINDYLETNYPNIFAVGDVSGPFQLTHAAGHQGWYAAVNALFGKFKKFRADYSVMPAATYTAPEVARVGINEKEAKAQGIDYDVALYGIDDLDRAIADGEDHGFIKVLTPKGKDKILGATIVGSHAGDLLAEFTLAMRHGLGLNKILGTVHPYPTMSEATKYTAGVWKQNNAPQQVLKWVAKFHTWQRNR